MTSWPLCDNICFIQHTLRYHCRPLITLLVGLALVRHIILYHWVGMGYLPIKGTVAFWFLCSGWDYWLDMTWSLRESKRRMLGLDLYSACIFICLLVALIFFTTISNGECPRLLVFRCVGIVENATTETNGCLSTKKNSRLVILTVLN